MALLAFLCLAATVGHFRHPDIVPLWVILAFSVVFLAEFMARFLDSESKVAYLRGHWLDLVTSIPAVGALRGFQVARPLVVGVRVVSNARRVGGYWYIWSLAVVFWVSASYALWLLERDAPHTTVPTFADALWWGIITMTTVGYGDTHPVTGDGRILGGLVAVVGLGLIGIIASQFTSWLEENAGSGESKTQAEVAALRQEIAELRTLIIRETGPSSAPERSESSPPTAE